jgi:hypothetical protein
MSSIADRYPAGYDMDKEILRSEVEDLREDNFVLQDVLGTIVGTADEALDYLRNVNQWGDKEDQSYALVAGLNRVRSLAKTVLGNKDVNTEGAAVYITKAAQKQMLEEARRVAALENHKATAEAQKEARRIIEQANREASRIKTDATIEKEKLLTDLKALREEREEVRIYIAQQRREYPVQVDKSAGRAIML